MSTSDTIHLPSIRDLVFGAVPRLIEGVLIPTALFLLLFNIFGIGAANIGSLNGPPPSSSYASHAGLRVPALVFVGLGVLLIRTILALATGSSFLYFIQPTLGAGVIGIVIITSAMLGRPVVLKIARDFLSVARRQLEQPSPPPVLPRHLVPLGRDASC